VLRKHGVGDAGCPGAGLPAVGELTEMHGLAGPVAAAQTAAVSPPAQQQRVASVA
jgi:hypothetical protein